MTFHHNTPLLLVNRQQQELTLRTGSHNEIYDCSVCSAPICDQVVYKVDEHYFHSLCFNCCECRTKLSDKCYTRDARIFCKEDFFKKFGTRCASCADFIPPNDIVRRANEFVYHLNCFACLICHRPLKTGDEFYLIAEQKLVCKLDYDTLKNKELEDVSKRPRTTITQKQLEVLKDAYHISSKPPRHVRESLAQETGLDMRVVQVWFQNRRAKEKRLNKDSNRRWSNNGRDEHKTTRMKIRKSHQDEESSNEGETAISYDELSDHDSDDSSSQLYTTPMFYPDLRARSMSTGMFSSTMIDPNRTNGTHLNFPRHHWLENHSVTGH